MSLTRFAPVGLAIATAVALAGCGSSAPAAIGPTITPSAAPTTAAAPSSSSSGSSGSSGSGGQAVSKCTYDDLKATVGPTTGEGQRHTPVVWTNESGRTCTMFGFGGVDLDGPPYPGQPATFSLRRTSKQPTTVRLEPGASAHTTITWLTGGDWKPTKILATPPDETRAAPLDWPGGAVPRQDGATRPGTYIDPVQPGAQG